MTTASDTLVRETALDPSRSFIVEAPAGSGKTELLMQRYLLLLATVEQPESVVAMTFTRKAAAEMKQRIVDALTAAQRGEPINQENDSEPRTRALALNVLTRDALLGWRLLEDPSVLQIQTIDSLCAMLTRQMPLLSDFGGSPRVEEHAEELYSIAARRTLAMLASGEPEQKRVFRNVVSHFESDLTSLEKQIVQMLGKRDQWLEVIARGDEDALRDLINRTLQDCQLSLIERAFWLWPAGIPDRPKLKLEFREQWRRFAEAHLLKNDPTPRRNRAFTTVLDKHPEFCAALYPCCNDLPLSIDDDQWDLVRDFVSLLWFTVIHLRSVFEERGEVDFTEVTRAAIQSLGTPEQPTDLLFRLDYRIEHLLVDEFQDTSVSQYNLIKALTAQWSDGDNRTLFVVGDPMQSIYGFRQAEVRLFLEVAQGAFGSVRLEHLQLTANFRSTPSNVGWVNSVFADLMPENDQEHGAVKFRESVASRQEQGAAPRIEPFIEDTDGDAEAEWVVQTAKRCLRKPGQTVAVLVRARSHVVKTIQAMRKHGIEYEAREIDELENEQHILDVLSITRSVLHVGDRLSWLACLRAPWCGLTLADLSALVEGHPRRTVLELLYDPDRIAALSPDGRLRAIRTAEILAAAVREVGHHPIRKLVESVWLSLGGPATLTHGSQFEDVEVLFALLDEFDEGGAIRDFSLLNDRLKFLYAKPQTGGDRVQIMTIHSAKGLQFDTVIIPRMESGRHSDDKPLLAWIERRNRDGKLGLLMAGHAKPGASDVLYDFVSGEMGQKQRHEDRRLLYVAATRAKNELYLSGNVKKSERGPGYSKPAGGSFLKFIWPVAEPVFDAAWLAWQKAQTAQQSLPLVAPPQTILRRLPADWQVPEAPQDVSAAMPMARSIASSRTVTYEWVSDVARHVGTIVHEYLRHFAEEGLAAWTMPRLESQQRVIESELRRFGTPLDEVDKAAARVMRALENIVQSDRARWILSPAPEARSEWAISGVVDGKLFDTRVDRTLVDAQGRRWIIDFKTGEHGGGSLDQFLAEEQRRYADQMSVYAALLSMREDRPVMLGLYFPLLDAWREWSFAEPAISVSAN